MLYWRLQGDLGLALVIVLRWDWPLCDIWFTSYEHFKIKMFLSVHTAGPWWIFQPKFYTFRVKSAPFKKAPWKKGMPLFNRMLSLRDRETLQQVRANTERRRQSSRTWIVPEFHQLAIVTPHDPCVIILMSKSKPRIFICACLGYGNRCLKMVAKPLEDND